MKRHIYNGHLKTELWMIIPILLMVSRSTITASDDSKAYVYALHITPWLEVGFNRRG
jgi:hypothetical protein